MSAKKKLTRSENNKVIAGVFGGLSQYFGVDANLLRLGYILVAVVTGIFPGILGYVVAALILPWEKESNL